MLAPHRKAVCLSLISTDLPILATVETAATLYQKDSERFHLLLSQPPLATQINSNPIPSDARNHDQTHKRLLWLEISPYRVIMTMQENGRLGYRHFWEQGIYGISRYWLHGYDCEDNGSLRLRNFTRSFSLEGRPFPHRLRVDYELWSDQLQLGHYVMHLEIR